MSKDRRTIFQFVPVGFGVPVIWLVYQGLTPPSAWSSLGNFLSVIFIILCLPVLLKIPFLDVATGIKQTYLIEAAAVVLLNVRLYAAVGSAYVGARSWRLGSTTS